MFKFYRYIESSDELKKLSIYICTIWNAISLYETFLSLRLIGPILYHIMSKVLNDGNAKYMYT